MLMCFRYIVFLYVAFFFHRENAYTRIAHIYIYIYIHIYIYILLYQIAHEHNFLPSFVCLMPQLRFFPQTKSGWFGQGHFRAGTLLSLPHRFGGGVPKRPSTLPKKGPETWSGMCKTNIFGIRCMWCARQR